MDTTRGLARRVERLEGPSGGASGCATCGAATGAFAAFVGGDVAPPWAEGGRCRDCRRPVRWYVGIDLALV